MSESIFDELDDNLFNQILDKIYSGTPLTRAVKHFHVSPKAFDKFVQQSPERIVSLGNAQDSLTDQIAEEILTISDEEKDQLRSRNRIDARKWYASKIRPKKYGDRLDVNISQVVDIGAALAKANGRLIPDSYSGQSSNQQVIETTAKDVTNTSGYEPETAKASENEEPDIFK